MRSSQGKACIGIKTKELLDISHLTNYLVLNSINYVVY
jgi:hypothetical protein